MYIFYGLPYCDATKLAMEWFKAHDIAFTLHDYKTQGITADKLQSWCTQKGWETILNKRSTTWRSLSPETQAAITTQGRAVETMVANTSLIKRPVITTEDGKVMAVGVNEKLYEKVFV